MSSSELFDVLTEEGIPSGATKPRTAVHRDGDWHACAHVWVINPVDKTVLLQRRVPTKDSWGGYWDISCAGHLTASEPGESSLASVSPTTQHGPHVPPLSARQPVMATDSSARSGAMRELAEELGITPEESELVPLGTLTQRHTLMREGRDPFIDNEFAHIYAYTPAKPMSASDFVLQQEEVSEVRWVPISALVDFYCGSEDTTALDEDIRTAGVVPLDDPQKYCSLVFSKWL